ncbi:hypothetical protein KIL84_000497, partial [Mauremys mutica]
TYLNQNPGSGHTSTLGSLLSSGTGSFCFGQEAVQEQHEGRMKGQDMVRIVAA